MAKGGYRNMEYGGKGYTKGSGSMSYNHGKACGMPGEGMTVREGNVVGTRARSFEGGTGHKKKRSSGKKMGMAY